MKSPIGRGIYWWNDFTDITSWFRLLLRSNRAAMNRNHSERSDYVVKCGLSWIIVLFVGGDVPPHEKCLIMCIISNYNNNLVCMGINYTIIM